MSFVPPLPRSLPCPLASFSSGTRTDGNLGGGYRQSGLSGSSLRTSVFCGAAALDDTTVQAARPGERREVLAVPTEEARLTTLVQR